MSPTVLLVDDQDLMIRIVRAALKPLDINLPAVQSGADAIAYFESHSAPDAVILDYMMPGLDGVETLRRLRQMPGGSSVPVLMLTMRDQTSIREAAEGLAVFEFMTKPFSPNSLRNAVRKMLGQHPNAGAA